LGLPLDTPKLAAYERGSLLGEDADAEAEAEAETEAEAEAAADAVAVAAVTLEAVEYVSVSERADAPRYEAEV